MENTGNKFDVLFRKIQDRLNRKYVELRGDNISLFDLNETLIAGFAKYNLVLINQLNENKKYMNRLISSLKGTVPNIFDIYPKVSENGDISVEVLFSNQDGKYKGEAYILEDGSISLNLPTNEYSSELTMKFLNDNLVFFINFLNALSSFRSEYSGFAYDWKNCKNSIQYVSDGFISCTINLNDLAKTHAMFSNISDLDTSRTRSKKYGELYDYVDFYNQEFMKKTEVNVNDLNPLFQAIVRKTLKHNMKLTKEV